MSRDTVDRDLGTSLHLGPQERQRDGSRQKDLMADKSTRSMARVNENSRLVDQSPFPESIEARLAAQLGFIAEIDRLKTVYRASPLAAAARRENDAEHSWHLAMMVMLLAEYADGPLDTAHAVKLVLIHDLVEIYAGDSPVFDTAAQVDQREREEEAAERLFELLPADQTELMHSLWQEFEDGVTPEARFGKAIDRLEPILLNWLNGGGTWSMPGATIETVRIREAGVVAASTALGRAAKVLVDEGVRRGWIRSTTMVAEPTAD
jgi:putative hydrolases of HD superfamily